MNQDDLLYKELKALEDKYKSPITIAEGLELNWREEVLKPVEFYINSRYLNGNQDEDGDLPFMNIVNANSDISKVATDFDTKDIRAESDDGDHYDMSFVFNKEIYNWMKDVNFAKTLNDMNSVRVDYGEVLVKKVEKVVDGEKQLFIEIPEWQNLNVDASNILERPIIEEHHMVASEFAEKMDVWQNVKDVLKIYNKSEADEIVVKEVNGKFPRAVYLQCQGKGFDEADEYTYGRYRFFVACIDNQEIYLYSDEQKTNPYKKLCWKKRAKRPGVGSIEEGIPAQIWTNDVIQKEHKWFELASKAVLQSATRSLKGRNVLTDIKNGIILEHDDGKPITAVNLVAAAVPEFQTLIEKWGRQYDRQGNVTDVVRGENPPSGQAFRLQALVQQQSASTFDQRREEMGIFIVEMFNDWILPFISKKLNKAHLLASNYSAEELKALDTNFSNYHANQRAKELILSGKIVTQEDYETFKQAYLDFIGQTKDRRFLDIPDKYYEGFKPKITIVTTGEQKNKMAVLETLSNVLTLYMTNPVVFQSDPVASQILSLILEKSGAGLSPITLGLGNRPAPVPASPVVPETNVKQPSRYPSPQQLAPQAQANA